MKRAVALLLIAIAFGVTACGPNKISGDALLSVGCVRLPDGSGGFILSGVTVKTAARRIGFKLADLQPIPDQPKSENRRTQIPGYSVAVLPVLRNGVPGSVSDPETICDVVLRPISN